MALELAQIVAELVEGIGCGGETVGLEHGLKELRSAPAQHLSAGVQEDFQEADHAGVMDFDAWEPHFAAPDREGEFLQQREVNMHVEALGLEGSEAVGDF